MTEKRVETPEAPVYLQPTVRLVNATLDEVRNSLSLNSKSERGLSEAQKELDLVLNGNPNEPGKSSLVYDGIGVTASDLQKALSPFSTENIGYHRIDSKFKELVFDLETIKLLEKGGLDAVNEKLGRLFESLKTEATTAEEKEGAIKEFNEMLGRAIYLFPHLAIGVEVKLKPGALERTEEIETRYYESTRGWFEKLALTYQNERGVPLPDSLVFPLPYGFTTGVHGSGERAAMLQSWEDIFLTSSFPRQMRGVRIPVLSLGIKSPLVIPDYVLFETDEIESIRFTEEGTFTPWVGPDPENSHKAALREKGDSVTCYLRFRNFLDAKACRKRENLLELSSEEWGKYNRELLTPRNLSNLWREDYHPTQKTLRKGFMGRVLRPSLDVTLYELTDSNMPRQDTDEAALLLYAKIQRGDKRVLARTQTYEGNDIIRRLVEIPVAERQF